MRRPLFLLGAVGLTALLPLVFLVPTPAQNPAPQVIAPTDPRTPEEERKGFHVPPGFEVELVAAEPQIHKPININFDDRGRLWLTDTLEYPFPAPPDRKPRDTVKVLEDSQGNGTYDKVTTFADGLNIPIGVLPTADGCWAYSIPNVYHYIDTKGTGQSDKREVLYGTIGEKVMRDTHGMTGNFTVGFDGWVYATHGFANSSDVKTADGSELKMQSGNIYRVTADGKRAEWWSHGQVNPFGMCIDPLGNLYSADCETKPVTLLLRGAYYQSFGKPHDGMGFAPEMCDHKHGSTAIAGCVYYAADHFPPAYRDTMFLGNVVTNRINHDRLATFGSTYRMIEQPDFLTSDDPWFRPVDIKLGPDGALYIADFYNKIIGHYEVPLNHPGRDKERGRIWRVVYRGPDGKGKPKPMADLTKAGILDLVDALADPNLTVRMRATDQLVQRDKDAVAELVGKVMQPRSNSWQRLHGMWVLERIGRLPEATLVACAQDGDHAVRVHAMRVLAERKELNDTTHRLAVQGLQDSDAFVQRAAADALGRHPNPDNVRPLIDLRAKAPPTDVQLVHGLRLALRDQLRPAENWKAVTAFKDADAKAIVDVCPGLPMPESAAFLINHLSKVADSQDVVQRSVHHAARYATPEESVKLVTWLRGRNPDDLRQQVGLLQEFLQGTQERGGQPSDEARAWAEQAVGKLLAAKENDLLQRGAELASALHLEKVQTQVLGLAHRKDLPDPVRRAALSALVNLNVKDLAAILGKIVADAGEPITVREGAALVLGGVNEAPAGEALVQVLPTAPARLQSVIAVALAGNKAGAERLFKAVAEGKASARLLLDKAVEARLTQSLLPDLKERVAKLTEGMPATDPKIAELLGKRRSGFAMAKADPKLGAEVFAKNCSACHQVGGKGGKVGPQLDGAGNRGVDRLLEDVLDPNAIVDQAFRASILSLKNGQVVTGLVLREEGEVLVVADGQGKEQRVTKGDVDERVVSQLSPMPTNLGEQISESDFYHLIAFLLTQRPPAETPKP